MLYVVYAIGLFANDRFAEAANSLLEVNYTNNEIELRKIITPQDYATYVSMCALTSFSRGPLKQVEENPIVHGCLETLPEITNIINCFLASKYKEVITMLQLERQFNKFNIFYMSKSSEVIKQIYHKVIQQYCLPYKSVDLRIMSSALGTDMKNLEEYLVQMSAMGIIKAKIDSHNKVFLYIINLNRSCI